MGGCVLRWWLVAGVPAAWAGEPAPLGAWSEGQAAAVGEVDALLVRAELALQQGQLSVAEADLEQARRLAEDVGTAQDRCESLLKLGRLRVSQGLFDQASTVLEGAGSAAVCTADPGLEADSVLALGILAARQGRYADADPLLRQALSLQEQARNLAAQAEAHAWLGRTYVVQMKLGLGADHLHAAEQAYLSIGSRYGLARVTLDTGRLRRNQEKADQAVVLFDRAMDQAREIGAEGVLADAELAKGRLRRAQNRYTEASPLLEQAMRRYTAMGDRAGQADAERAIGFLQSDLHQAEEARATLRHAVDTSAALSDLRGEADGRYLLSRALLREGRLDEAAIELERTIALLDRMDSRYSLYQALNSYSGLEAARGDLHRAWELGQRALDRLDQVIFDVGDEGSYRIWDENHVNGLAGLTALAVTLDRPDEALEIALRLKNVGFLWYRALARAVADLGPEDREAIQTRLAARRRGYDGVGMAYAEALVDPEGGADATLLDTRQSLDDADRGLVATLGLTAQATAHIEVQELQEALARDPRHPVLAVYYTHWYYGPETAVLRVWVLDGQQTRTWTLASWAAADRGSSKLAEIWDRANRMTGALRRAGAARDAGALAAALQNFLPNDAARLYDLLVRPWEDVLACDAGPCRPLLIEPDSALYDLPFQALIRTEAPGQDLSVDPMGSVRSATFLGRQTPLSALHSSGLLVTRFQVPSLDHGALVLGSPTGAGLGRAERQEVATAWRRMRRSCRPSADCPDGALRGERASAEALDTWLPRVSVAYLSAHGLYQRGRSLLLLANALASPTLDKVPRNTQGKGVGALKGLTESTLGTKGGPHALRCNPAGTDNCVFSEEVLRSFLRAELVVLSACASAQGDPSRAEGQIGLTRALIMGGANTVLSALWPVATEQTRDWMDVFTRARFVDGQPTAEAVLAARRALHGDVNIGGLTFPQEHPFFWAGFTLYGYDIGSLARAPARR